MATRNQTRATERTYHRRFYSIGAKVRVEQETANYFKTAIVRQMGCGEVRVQYLSGKKE
jgi:hypothetical protein